jgi:O-Antigen ligase
MSILSPHSELQFSGYAYSYRTKAGGAGGLFFALTGTLMATSVFNVGNSGISLYYLVFLLPLIGLVFPDHWFFCDSWGTRSIKMTLLIWMVIAALIATTSLQIIVLNLRGSNDEFVHLLSRLSFLAYFVMAQRYVQGVVLSRTLIWLRRLLIVVCAYGVYQMPAKLLGLPLFLDWLRNNRSFDMYSYDTSGWIGIVRATSIYAEPSQATIPILVLFMLNLRISTSTRSKVAGWAALLLFALASFSRTVWLALLAGTLVLLLLRSPRLSRMVQTKRLILIMATLLLLLISPVWGFIEASNDADLSVQERSGGIVLGLQMIKDAPILGSGWNSFGNVAQRYTNSALFVDSSIDFGTIHSMVVSYVQQAGISGLFLATLPFILLVRWSTAPLWMTYGTVASFLVAAELGDIGYSALTWLWIALLINMRSAEGIAQMKRKNFTSWQQAGKDHMSALPYSPS